MLDGGIILGLNFSWVTRYWPLMLEGLWTTLVLLFWSGLLGFALALLVGLARISRNLLLNGAALGFTSIIRGTPLLVQIFILYYGMGSLFAAFPAIRQTFLWPYLRDDLPYLILALTLSVGGYVGEIIRGALLSVPKGEIEAGRAYGLSGFTLLRRIWLPRALQGIVPTLAGETVLLLKSTALASTIAVVDLLGAANRVRTNTLIAYEPLIAVAVVYFVLTMVIERGFKLVERRATRAYRR
jgi:polar amino acid transport system permease protein